MTIRNFDDLIASFEATQLFSPVKYGAVTQANLGYWNTSFVMAGSNLTLWTPPQGPISVCDGSTQGRIPVQDAAPGKQLHLARFLFSPSQAVGCYLMDRLVQALHLDGNIGSYQDVNTPDVPERAGNGEGAEIYVECWSQTGVTARSMAIDYTNSDGVSGRRAWTTIPASMRYSAAARAYLQPGDTGVRSIEGCFLQGGGTGLQGSLVLTISKRVVGVSNIAANSVSGVGPFSGGLPAIPNDSCLYFITNSASTTSPSFDTELAIVEG
jgi:hypothetical protein